MISVLRNFPLVPRKAPVLEHIKKSVIIGKDKITVEYSGTVYEVPVDPEVVDHVGELREGGCNNNCITDTVARSQWAQDLARAFCLPENERDRPFNQLDGDHIRCIDRMSYQLASELV